MNYGIVDLSSPSTPIVLLDQAQLCQDCDAISAAPNGACARCSSKSLLSLARVLNRPANEEEVPPVFYESPLQRQARVKRALWVEGML